MTLSAALDQEPGPHLGDEDEENEDEDNEDEKNERIGSSDQSWGRIPVSGSEAGHAMGPHHPPHRVSLNLGLAAEGEVSNLPKD